VSGHGVSINNRGPYHHSEGVYLQAPSGTGVLNPSQVSGMIVAHPNYNPGEDILLIQCFGGRTPSGGGTSFAEQVAQNVANKCGKPTTVIGFTGLATTGSNAAGTPEPKPLNSFHTGWGNVLNEGTPVTTLNSVGPVRTPGGGIPLPNIVIPSAEVQFTAKPGFWSRLGNLFKK